MSIAIGEDHLALLAAARRFLDGPKGMLIGDARVPAADVPRLGLLRATLRFDYEGVRHYTPGLASPVLIEQDAANAGQKVERGQTVDRLQHHRALPALDGASLTNLTAANIAAGSLGASVIASSVGVCRLPKGPRKGPEGPEPLRVPSPAMAVEQLIG